MTREFGKFLLPKGQTNMTEEKRRSPSEAKKREVNYLRHLTMDPKHIPDNAAYLAVYVETMLGLAKVYPDLAEEILRQIAKKRRRITARGFHEVQCGEQETLPSLCAANAVPSEVPRRD